MESQFEQRVHRAESHVFWWEFVFRKPLSSGQMPLPEGTKGSLFFIYFFLRLFSTSQSQELSSPHLFYFCGGATLFIQPNNALLDSMQQCQRQSDKNRHKLQFYPHKASTLPARPSSSITTWAISHRHSFCHFCGLKQIRVLVFLHKLGFWKVQNASKDWEKIKDQLFVEPIDWNSVEGWGLKMWFILL